MTKTLTTRYDVAEHLRTPEEMAAYLEACLEEANGDAAFVAKALGDIARAKGMAQVARDAGLSRESLYKALSGERSPAFDTILKVVAALGLKLRAEAAHGNEFLQAMRPILFGSSLGDHSSESVYGSIGTSFLVSYNSQYYLITANHVIKSQSANHDMLRIFPTDTSNYTIPFNTQYELKPSSQNEQEEYHDIYLMRIDIAMQLQNSDSPLFAIDLKKAIMSPESLPIDVELVIIGFPDDTREVDHERLKIKYKRSVMSAKYKGRSSSDHYYSLCITNSLGHKSINGMSGSPVFYFKEGKIPRLVGMMTRGSVESGNGYFISALVLKKALDEIIAQEA